MGQLEGERVVEAPVAQKDVEGRGSTGIVEQEEWGWQRRRGNGREGVVQTERVGAVGRG